MRIRFHRMLSTLCISLFLLSVSGVYAVWQYFDPIEPPPPAGINIQLNEFNYDPGEILYISDIEYATSSNLPTQLDYKKTLPTYVTVKGEVSRSNSSVTYKVTVFNNTDVTYWYVGQRLTDYGTNNLISSGAVKITTKEKTSDTSNTFNSADWVPARTKRDFYITYTFNSGSVGNIDLFVNYYFSIRIDGVEDEFLRVLNDNQTQDGLYYYLADAFNENYAESKSKQINSVSEQEVFDNLFGGNLTIDVDGVETPVTVLVERTNVDGKSNTGDKYTGNGAPSGCEYTVYITTDTLVAGQRATVYAITYSCGTDGVWYKVGQLYEGTAYVTNTSDGPMIKVNGDIKENDPISKPYNNETWVASKETYVIYQDGGNKKTLSSLCCFKETKT